MPLFDFECSVCEKVEERIFKTTEEIPEEDSCACGGKRKRIISFPARKTDMGDNRYPYWEENMGETPVLLESSAHRKQELKRRGLAEADKRRPGMPGQWV